MALRWLRGKAGWRDLRFQYWFLAMTKATFGVAWPKPIVKPTRKDLEADAAWIRDTLRRWMIAGEEDVEAQESFARIYTRTIEHEFKNKKPRDILLGQMHERDRLRIRHLDPRLIAQFSNDHIAVREAYALHLFRLAADIVGRCARCGKWFCKNRSEQAYCSRQHKQAGINEGRRKGTLDALKTVRECIAAWTPRNGEWKQWVATRARVTPKFITRHLNNGNLQPPKGAASQ